MSTTMINNKSTIPSQPLGHYDAAVYQRVQQWLASGELLAWIPILNQQNFPGVAADIRQAAQQHQEAMRWPIHCPEDLLELPEGMTGWLLPAAASDTDVACGVCNGEVYILGVRDQRTGAKQTLRGECDHSATEAHHQSAV